MLNSSGELYSIFANFSHPKSFYKDPNVKVGPTATLYYHPHPPPPKKNNCNKIRTDNNGRIIVLEVEIDDEIFILINPYNPNTEAVQVK